jgi:Fe2+ or Zn2+ uptake regulation protein
MPHLSLGTVYRNLQQMARDGRLMEIDGPIARFDGNIYPHTHLRCQKCGCVADVELPYDAALDRAFQMDGWNITGHSLIFTGICPACAGES